MKPMVSEVSVRQGHSFTSKCLKGLMLGSITSSYLLPRGNLAPMSPKGGSGVISVQFSCLSKGARCKIDSVTSQGKGFRWAQRLAPHGPLCLHRLLREL